MHFSARTFLAPYLHQYSAVMQIMDFFGAMWFTIEIIKLMQNQLILMVLFETNLVINIRQNIKKAHIYHHISTILMQIKCRFDAHFNWVSDHLFFLYCFFHTFVKNTARGMPFLHHFCITLFKYYSFLYKPAVLLLLYNILSILLHTQTHFIQLVMGHRINF